MDFAYTPEQIQLRKSVREFAEAEILPHVMEWDEAQIFPLETIRKLRGARLRKTDLPRREIEQRKVWTSSNIPSSSKRLRSQDEIGGNRCHDACIPINHDRIFGVGSDGRRKRYLPRLAAGECSGAGR